MGWAIFIPRRMSSAEVSPSCWPTAVPRTSAALGPPKAPPQVRDQAQLDARADDLQQQRATEDADRVLVHLVAEPCGPSRVRARHSRLHAAACPARPNGASSRDSP